MDQTKNEVNLHDYYILSQAPPARTPCRLHDFIRRFPSSQGMCEGGNNSWKAAMSRTTAMATVLERRGKSRHHHQPRRSHCLRAGVVRGRTMSHHETLHCCCPSLDLGWALIRHPACSAVGLLPEHASSTLTIQCLGSDSASSVCWASIVVPRNRRCPVRREQHRKDKTGLQ